MNDQLALVRVVVPSFEQAAYLTAEGQVAGRTRHPELAGQRFLDEMAGLPQPATFMRKEVTDTVGVLDASFHFALDGEFFMRAVGNFRAVRLERVLATMRMHPASKSVSAGTGFASEIVRVGEKVIASPASYPRYRVVPARVRAAADYGAARHLTSSASASTFYWRTIVTRMLPRFVARGVLGKDFYQRLGAWLSRARP